VEQERTKEDERWASRGLVSMLIREMKNYKAAAEIESGSEDVFAACKREIADKVVAINEDPSAVAALELQKALDNASAEIEEHERWQTQVFKNLPPEDDEQGLTGPLRQSFTKSALTRAKLKTIVESVHDEYFRSQSSNS
jgi:hypothetical protein